MDNKKRNLMIVIFLVVATIGFGVFAYLGISRDFDASRHVDAVLAQKLKGDFRQIKESSKNFSEEKASEEYEKMIANTTEQVFCAGINMQEPQKKQCLEITRELFKSLKYEVGEAEKVGKEEYKVPVTFKSVDLIDKIKELLQQEMKVIKEKVEKGEAYRGTEEDIQMQIDTELALKYPKILEEAYKSMSYQDEQTIVFVVKKNEKGLYVTDGAQINEFVTKILGLNVKED